MEQNDKMGVQYVPGFSNDNFSDQPPCPNLSQFYGPANFYQRPLWPSQYNVPPCGYYSPFYHDMRKPSYPYAFPIEEVPRPEYYQTGYERQPLNYCEPSSAYFANPNNMYHPSHNCHIPQATHPFYNPESAGTHEGVHIPQQMDHQGYTKHPIVQSDEFGGIKNNHRGLKRSAVSQCPLASSNTPTVKRSNSSKNHHKRESQNNKNVNETFVLNMASTESSTDFHLKSQESFLTDICFFNQSNANESSSKPLTTTYVDLNTISNECTNQKHNDYNLTQDNTIVLANTSSTNNNYDGINKIESKSSDLSKENEKKDCVCSSQKLTAVPTTDNAEYAMLDTVLTQNLISSAAESHNITATENHIITAICNEDGVQLKITAQDELNEILGDIKAFETSDLNFLLDEQCLKGFKKILDAPAAYEEVNSDVKNDNEDFLEKLFPPNVTDIKK